ncbi:hypothetical protein BpHYR1_050859 [Brachionus plicatilis]|uniref:Uncharacterized protein n=1 Tax=Brachionus plicatilis TaxID=10195 RepID=A0A3M7PV64_BRAPC|nr:hypothetical protein BpHYR1_050859 [Brachionus plicatilis]
MILKTYCFVMNTVIGYQKQKWYRLLYGLFLFCHFSAPNGSNLDIGVPHGVRLKKKKAKEANVICLYFYTKSRKWFCEVQYKRTEQSFKINSVNAEWCNIQSCIKC